MSNLYGGDGNDYLVGTEEADEFSGGGGNDTLVGGGGDDFFDGGAGSDVLVGGAGNDWYFVGDDLGDTIVEEADGGWDAVDVFHSYSLEGTHLDAVYASAASGDVTLTGNGLVNQLLGGSGNDILDGGAGADGMSGGMGNDSYHVDSAEDVIWEEFEDYGGHDTVHASVSYSLEGVGLEDMVLVGDAYSGTGNDLDNVITGNSNANLLTGGLGSDVLDGGAGDDTYVVARGDGADVIDDLSGNGTVRFGAGIGRADLTLTIDGSDLVVVVGAGAGGSEGAEVRLRNWVGAAERVTQFTFEGEEPWTFGNQPPVASDDASSVTEDGAAATGNVLANDSDPNNDALTVADAGSRNGSYGTLQLNADGSYSYALDSSRADIQALGAGQQLTETFQYTATDAEGATSTASLTVTIDGANDGPGARDDSATAQEDGAPVTGNLLLNDSDADAGDVLSVTSTGTFTGLYGTFTVAADGSYRYELANDSEAVQALRQGESVADQFEYTVTDAQGATATAALSIRIVGTNDGPVATADRGAVTEDGPNLASNVLSNDTDRDAGDTRSVSTAGTFVGQYGTLVLDAAGGYNYQLNNASAAVQALGAGQQVTDSFSYTVTDGSGATSTASIAIDVAGANDGPTLETAAADVQAKQGKALAIDLPDTMFKDIDQGDVLGYAAQLSNGTALPAWLQFDPAGLRFTGTPPAGSAGQAFDVRLTAIDRSGATASDVFRISIGAPDSSDLVLVGGSGRDMLVGGSGNDSLDGRGGADTMKGGAGNDTYTVDYSFDHHHWWCGFNGSGDSVVEYANQGWDTVNAKVDYVLPQHVEALRLQGTGNLSGTGNDASNWLVGNSGNNVLLGDGGDDLLSGGAGSDFLFGGSGRDVLEGQSGNDYLLGGEGNDAMLGGTGSDTLISGSGKGFLAGGAQNDNIVLGAKAAVLAFNRGDGADQVEATGGAPLVISLGGGIRMEDVALRRNGKDLVIDVGNNESISLNDWYQGSGNRPQLKLQFVTEAASGGDALHNNKVEWLDGQALVGKFDKARQSNPTISRWNIMSAALSAHLGGSDTAALGGDLAYQYGTEGTLSGTGLTAAAALLGDAGFGTQVQSLQSTEQLQTGFARIMG